MGKTIGSKDLCRKWRTGDLLSRSLFLIILLLLVACSDGDASGNGPSVDRGKRIFSQHCSTCHSTKPDVKIVGPSLSSISSRAENRVDGLDAGAYILQSITKPDAYIVDNFDDLMPPDFDKKISDEDLDSLIVYLLTLE